MKFSSRWVIPAVALVGIGVMVYTVAMGDTNYPVNKPMAEPPRSEFTETLAGAGLVEPLSQNIAVATAVPGVVEQLWVAAGSHVSKGDRLFSIDSRSLAAECLMRESAVDVASARLAETQVELAEAREKLAKVSHLSDARAVSKEEVSLRTRAVEAALARIGTAKAALAQARAAVAQSRVELDRLVVKAPGDGEVLQLNIRVGEQVSPGQQLAPLIFGDTRQLHLRVDIDEAEAWRFKAGVPAVAHLKGNAAVEIPLEYVRTEPLVIPKHSLTGESTERVDTRVLQVVYLLKPSPARVHVGEQMDVFIQAEPRPVAKENSPRGRSS
ncbi:efflux RND transporter periplasmic adaptor subunit [Dyella tabacisoli]|uniref:Biotin/lipoyl-binding protein n=1 Tax=Dyella tabacisoli TaxID=2282381 RepID=A0A369ULC4_9GAMM|nr:efflux RND transporter periplasmic adaptor subunit [Dyella tabacisoli]RDD81307.1 biotin/lipoyl-binding protein [Dyella tabacisoli]